MLMETVLWEVPLNLTNEMHVKVDPGVSAFTPFLASAESAAGSGRRRTCCCGEHSADSPGPFSPLRHGQAALHGRDGTVFFLKEKTIMGQTHARGSEGRENLHTVP